MDELVEWVRAQLDEDERLARRAAELCGCHPPALSWSFRDGDEPGDGRILVVDDPHPDLKRKIGRRWNSSYEGLHMAEHIVRHDPARVLREIDAKRRILAEHALNGWVCTTCDNGEVEQVFPCPTLRLLALPYADQPGYREEWRP